MKYNKQLDSNNINTIIHNVCSECWIKANKATQLKKFKKIDKQTWFSVSTFHKWICDFCKKEKSITQARDFFYPDFNLINK